MKIFRRVLRTLFILAGFVTGLAAAVAAFFARRLISPPRQRLWANPGDLGLQFETVHFPAQDGLRLAGWFVPAKVTNGGATAVTPPTAVLVHGWPWNRLGEAAEDPLNALDGTEPVDLLRLLLHLHNAGYHVFSFDLRNHGESAAMPPVTFGVQEAKDLLGALDYLNGRSDVDAARIGVIGFSMGANTLLYALPHTERVKAAVAVQPVSVGVFAGNYGRYLLGPLATVVLPLAEMIYRSAGGFQFDSIRPASAASSAGSVPILYVQGTGDPWGSTADVQAMADVTPRAEGPLFVESVGRFEGYRYVIDHPEVITGFLQRHL